MATIIDALMLTMSLDPSGFVKGSKEVQQSHKKLKETIVSESKEAEKASIAASAGVAKITKEVLGLLAVFTGGKAIKDFIGDISKADSVAGRFARNMGVTTQTLSAWQGVLERNGGTAEDAAASFQAMSDSINEIKVTGNSGMLPFLYKLGGETNTVIRTNAGAVASFMDLSNALSKLAKTDPGKAHYYGMAITHNEAMTNLLMQGPAALQKQLDLERKIGLLSKEEADAAEKRVAAWADFRRAGERFGDTILTAVTPALLKMNELLQNFVIWAREHLPQVKQWFNDTFGNFDDVLKKIDNRLRNFDWKGFGDGVKAFAGDVKAVAQWIDKLVTGTTGWRVALEALLALKVASWLIPVAFQLGLINTALAAIVGLGPSLSALFAIGGPLAALAALYGVMRPTPLNEGENEIERQQKYGQGGGAGAGAAPSGGAPSETGGGAHAAESNRRPAPGEFGTPWNHQTGGPPASGGGSSGGGGASGHAETHSGAYGPQLPGGGKRRLMGRGSGIGSGLTDSSGLTTEDFLAGIKGGEGVPYSGFSSTGAIGAYGLTGGFIKQWAPGAGLPTDRNSYKNNKELQDRLATYAAEQMYQQYGSWRAVANAWLTGSPTATTSQPPNMSPAAYDAKVLRVARAHAAKRAGQGTENNTPAPSETNAYVAPGANQGDASQAPGTAPGAGVRKSFNGQPYTDYFATPAEAAAPKLKDNMTTAEINAWNAAHGGAAAGNAWQKALHSLARPHEHAKKLLQHISAAHVPNVGAATSAQVANHHSTVNSHNTNASNETHVGQLVVNTSAADASGIVRDIKPVLERAHFAYNANYSLA